MNKKKTGLKISEVLLITVTVLLGIAIVVAFLLRSGAITEYLSMAGVYLLGMLTFGATLPQYYTIGEFVYPMRTLMFVLVDIFIYASLILGAGMLFLSFYKKKFRALSGVAGFLLSTLLMAYGSGFIIPVLQVRDHISRSILCPLVGVSALVLVTYVASAIGIAAEFKDVVVMSALEGKTVSEEKKEEKPAPAKEAAPVEVKVVVEHKNEPAPKKEEPKVEPKKEEPKKEEPKVEEPAPEKRKIERVPFEYKILHSDKDLKKKYAELKEYFESYGLKGRISVDGDSYRLHRVLYVQITVAGKKMKVYFKLKPMDYVGSPIPVKDASHVKKYAEIPAELDVKSDLSVKRAKELIDKVMGEAGIEKPVK